jgi:UDP-3-O-[3-hydroxymyristoyl] N-acetylglucosamine deacetylase
VLQRTIARDFTLHGVGVHSAAPVAIRVRPAPAGAGISFVRSDLSGPAAAPIPAHIDALKSAQNSTNLANGAGGEIATVEHLLASCSALGLDNLLVEVSGPEMGIMDGSAKAYAEALIAAGVTTQAGPQRRAIEVLKPVEIVSGAKRAALTPSEARVFDVTIRFTDPAIGTQRLELMLNPAVFAAEVAPARTFGFLADLEAYQAKGLAMGASLENTIAIADGRVVNPEGLRYPDEFVRHKMLDAIGDLALAGAPILGRFEGDQPGHALNTQLVLALLADETAWRWVELPD